MTRRPVRGKVESRRHQLAMLLRPLGDRIQTPRAGDHRRHRDREDHGQRIAPAVTTPMIGDRLQCFEETQHRRMLSNMLAIHAH